MARLVRLCLRRGPAGGDASLFAPAPDWFVLWTPDGLETQVIKAKATSDVDKHLHDARGTFATRLRLRLAGPTASEIADVLGWEEDRVQRLLDVYVDRDSIVRALASRLNKAQLS